MNNKKRYMKRIDKAVQTRKRNQRNRVLDISFNELMENIKNGKI